LIASLITTAFKSERRSAPVDLKTMKALSNTSPILKQKNHSVCRQHSDESSAAQQQGKSLALEAML